MELEFTQLESSLGAFLDRQKKKEAVFIAVIINYEGTVCLELDPSLPGTKITQNQAQLRD